MADREKSDHSENLESVDAIAGEAAGGRQRISRNRRSAGLCKSSTEFDILGGKRRWNPASQ